MTFKQTRLLLVDFKIKWGPRKGETFLSLWTQYAQANGIDKNDKAKRLEIFTQILGRPIASANDITDNKEVDKLFTAVKAGADSLTAARELDNPEMGDTRRLRWKIEEAKSELAAFIDNIPAYVAEIIKDKFNRGRSRRVEIITEDDLQVYQLRQLLVTLTARLQDAKHSDQVADHNLAAEEEQSFARQPEHSENPF